MTEKTKPHRAGSMSDADRALIGRKHTPPATPTEVDEEATPLPTEPPSPELVDGYQDLSPPLRKILLDQHNTLREHDIALGRVWPARHIDVRVAELGAGVKSLSEIMVPLRNVPGVLRAQALQIDQIQRRTAGLHAATTKLDEAIDGLNKELQAMRLEREREKHARELFEHQVTSEFKAMHGRLATHEEAKADHSERLKSLETDRTKVKAWAALIGLLAGILATIGAWVASRLAK